MTTFVSFQGGRVLLAGSDNRITLYDADSQKRQRSFVEKNYLAHAYTSFAMVGGGGNSNGSSSSSSSSGGKRRNSGGGDGGDELLAIGCSDGTIILWNLVTGMADKVLGNANESPVPTDLAFSNDGNSLFVSSQSSLVQYSVKDGALVQALKAGKHGALKLAMNPKAAVLAIAGESSVKLVELATGRRRKLDAHLAGGTAALSFSQCGQFLAVSASGVREVLVFDIHHTSQLSPIFVHAVGGVPRELTVRSRSSDSGHGRLVDVLTMYQERSGGCIVRITTSDPGEEVPDDLQPCKTDIDSTVALLGATFCKNARLASNIGDNVQAGTANSKDCLRFALGAYTSPFFGEVCFGIGGDGISAAINLEDPRAPSSEEKQQGQLSNGISGSAGSAVATILGPNEMGGKKRPAVGLEVGSEAATSSLSKKSKTGGSNQEDQHQDLEQELTLEQRLASLSSSMEQLEQRYASSTSGEQPAPTADSLVTLVDQALQTGDDALLEQCLGHGDEDVIDGTARRLPVARVVLLLRRLVSKFEKRPSRSQLLTRWLASVLKHHTAYLFSVPDLSFQLPGLSQMLEHRLGTYVPLAGLGGRLDLLMAQISSGAHGLGGAASGRAVQAPNMYVEED